jgi:methylated-DNA-[protein]-cysteine S-methyltransferase
MRRNPLPVVVPCHRVVSSAGKLHGYGGSTDPHGNDLQRKAALLNHERAMRK